MGPQAVVPQNTQEAEKDAAKDKILFDEKRRKELLRRKKEKHRNRYARYGTKIKTICETLTKIKRDDPKAKVIVFCQWQNLQKKIAAALKEFKFKYSVVEGTVHKKNRVLSAFQNDEPQEDGSCSPEILLMSLESAASGANCTAASYVFFVHPMNSATVDIATSYEQQAIGRVRRLGQTRKEIHVYRFVMQDTVEEVITRENELQLKIRRKSSRSARRSEALPQLL